MLDLCGKLMYTQAVNYLELEGWKQHVHLAMGAGK